MSRKVVPSPGLAWGQTRLTCDGVTWDAPGSQPGTRPSQEHLSHTADLHSEDRSKKIGGIASDLESTMFQGTLGEAMPLSATPEATSSDSPNRHFLARAPNLLRRMVDDALQSLRPAAGPCTDLERALCSLRTELMFHPTMQYRLFVTGRRMPLNQELQQQIYFIAQEAVTNAVHHSEATTIEVEVQYLSRRLRVIVRDNGQGMDPQALRSKRDSHGGLLGMLERAANIDGQLKIWSTKGAGTEIEISVSAARN